MSRTSDTPGLTEYLTALAGEDEALARVNRETGRLPEAQMQSRPDQGALLTFLARLVQARVALEVGTFTGYGAICIARGLAEGGRLTCLEVDEHWAAVARANLEAAGVADRVTVEVGPAADALALLPEEPHVDFAYVDADKTGYPDYYEQILPRMKPNALLLIDNILMGGDVVDPEPGSSNAVVAELNAKIAQDERVDAAFAMVADGIAFVRKRRVASYSASG